MVPRFVLAAMLLSIAALAARDNSDDQLTPREMFYSRSDAPPPPPAVSSASSPVNKPRHRPRPASTEVSAQSRPAPAEASATPAETPVHAEKVADTGEASEGSLGLRYTVVRVTANGSVDASDGDVFHAGDCVQLKVESNAAGYLYVLHHGPDGNWQPLMPSPKMPDESNRIEAFKEVQIPARYCFRFDNNPGTETLFLAVAGGASTMPLLRKAIFSENESTQPASKPEPEGPTMLALNLDHQVDALRGRGMDIMQVERVVEGPKDATQAHAVYVVNRADAPTDRVIAEIRLRHE